MIALPNILKFKSSVPIGYIYYEKIQKKTALKWIFS